METDWLQARQTRYTAYVTLYILVVIGALGLANWLANRHNKSYRHHVQQAVQSFRPDR